MRSTILGRTMLVAAAITGLAGTLSRAEAARAQETRDTLATRLAAGWRPAIGISYHPAAAVPGAGTREGILVVGVRRDGPAEKAGIQRGDRIVAVNGQRLDEPVEGEEPPGAWTAPGSRERARAMALFADMQAGEPIELEIERDGESMTFIVTPVLYESVDFVDAATSRDLGFFTPDSIAFDSVRVRLVEMMDDIGSLRLRRPEFRVGRVPARVETYRFPDEIDSLLTFRVNPSIRVRDVNDRWGYRFEYFGSNRLEVVRLNPELGSYFGTEEGVLVLDVDEESTLGLRPGDVVVKIGGRQVDDVSDMRRILASYEDDEKVDFGIWRDGAEATVVGTIR